MFAYFDTDNKTLARAWRIATGDLATNIKPCKLHDMPEEREVILAGLDYDFPWTRDAAINTWNAAGLIMPEVARDTLLSMIQTRDGKSMIGDQYWDAIIWVIGAWQHYLYTGDKNFLRTALEVSRNAFAFFEETEFDADLNLFRGPATTCDGIAGYPDIYAQTEGHSCILDWVKFNQNKKYPKGYGIPMKALSTNCLYYGAYRAIANMQEALEGKPDPLWQKKSANLRAAINEHFWMPEKGTYRYLVDPFGNSDRFECLGIAYAIMFGVADDVQAAQALENTPVQPAGVPCVWPSFERYVDEEGYHVGRHSGCVWPPFQAMWAHAAKLHGKHNLWTHELNRIAEFAVRDNHFVEMYHPQTGEVYGGLQENGEDPLYLWKSTDRQTWSATGYMRLILYGILGMQFDTKGLTFAPHLPEATEKVRLWNLRYRDMRLDISVTGTGDTISQVRIDGEKVANAALSTEGKGERTIEIELT